MPKSLESERSNTGKTSGVVIELAAAIVTDLHLGYVEQLYTFGDRFRDPTERVGGPRPVSVGYLALVRQTAVKSAGKGPAETAWGDWYRHFPWEDWREGPPASEDTGISTAASNGPISPATARDDAVAL